RNLAGRDGLAHRANALRMFAHNSDRNLERPRCILSPDSTLRLSIQFPNEVPWHCPFMRTYVPFNSAIIPCPIGTVKRSCQKLGFLEPLGNVIRFTVPCKAYGILRICCAIRTAVGAPRGLAAAKQRRKIGTFFELHSGRGLSATFEKTVCSR